MERNKLFLITLLSLIFLITSLSGCEGVHTAKTSYSDEFVSDYFDDQMKMAKENIPLVFDKYNQVIHLVKNLEYTELDTINKLVVDVPLFVSSSDSCRYNPNDLVTYFTLYDLDSTIENPLKDLYSSMGLDLRLLLNIAHDIQGGQYTEPSGSNSSKVTKICKELYNLKVLWESKYLFVMEVEEYNEVPFQPYAKSTEGSSLKANWHVFDFSDVHYLGSIPFELNNDGFTAKNSKTITSEKVVSKRKLLPSVMPTGEQAHVTHTETVTETSEVSTSYKNKVRQAEYNFEQEYTKTARNAVKKYVLNSNKKFRDLVNLR